MRRVLVGAAIAAFLAVACAYPPVSETPSQKPSHGESQDRLRATTTRRQLSRAVSILERGRCSSIGDGGRVCRGRGIARIPLRCALEAMQAADHANGMKIGEKS